jgi:hypothetical protein
VAHNPLDEDLVERDGAKVLIAEIEAGSPADEFYDSKVRVFPSRSNTTSASKSGR